MHQNGQHRVSVPQPDERLKTELRRLVDEKHDLLDEVQRLRDGHLSKADYMFNYTDLGNAERLVAWYGEDLRYCSANSSWYYFDGIRWAKDEKSFIQQKAIETVMALWTQAGRTEDKDFRKQITDHARRSESTSRIKAMIEAASWQADVQISPLTFDTDPLLLNVLNGTIYLRARDFRIHRKEDFLSKLAPVIYDESAECPTWEAFLYQIMDGNPNLISYLKRFTGYTLTGLTSEQILAIFYGSGANGKSTFTETIAALMGDYAQQTPTDTLTVKKNPGVPNDVARLHGARFVSAVETSEDNRLAEALVKQMTGGDRITARFLHREFFEFTPVFKLVLATNHKPVIRGTDEAIWRRIHLVPFSVTIPPEERDPRLKDKLRAELSGILNWALEGCIEWQAIGLQPPPEVLAATDFYRLEMDTMSSFFEECCTIDPLFSIKASELYTLYKHWSERTGEQSVTQREFGLKMNERGFERFHTREGWNYKGVGRKPKRENHDSIF